MKEQRRLGRALGSACLALLMATCYGHAQYLATSAEHTIIFGVEADPADSVRIDQQHADINFNYFGGVGEVSILADDYSDLENPAAGTAFALDEAHLYSNQNDRQVMGQPSIDGGFGFIGADVGETFWFISASSGGDSIFLGLSAAADNNNQLVEWNPGDSANGANFSAKFIKIELVSVNAPDGGDFSIFDINSPAPPTIYMATSDGIDANDVYYSIAGSHDHVNWSFSESGIYEVTIRMTTMVPASYENWAWDNGMLDSLNSFDKVAPNGLSYGVLYALGLDPTMPDTSAKPHLALADDKPAFYLDLPEVARPDITYEIWKTTDLKNSAWAMISSKAGDATWTNGTATISTSGGRTSYQHSEVSALNSGEQVAYQLRVNQSP